MNINDRVRLTLNPGRIGVIVRFLNEVIVTVDFNGIIENHVCDDLELLDDLPADPFLKGQFGRIENLRLLLVHEKLSGKITNIIYSKFTTNTDFMPYQFKPVLNVIQSPSDGLLIADEVGLGKTIEAGLVWTELRSRVNSNRLLVICPSVLTEKWKMELTTKFGIDAEIVNVKRLWEKLSEQRVGNRQSFACIISLQASRPNKNWESEKLPILPNNNPSQFAKYLDELGGAEKLIDLLIIDEVHHMKNPETVSYDFGMLMRRVSEYVLLLSATPIHNQNEDLFTILKILDEFTFDSPEAFKQILRAIGPLNAAREKLRNPNPEKQSIINDLVQTANHPIFVSNQQLPKLITEMKKEESLSDPKTRVEYANRIEQINILSKAINRTRKRDVEQNRVIRQPFLYSIRMNDAEKKAYSNITRLVYKYAQAHGGLPGFLMVMPQRQISSSVPAAIKRWMTMQHAQGIIQEEDYINEYDVDTIYNNFGPLTSFIIENLDDTSLSELIRNDTKFTDLYTKIIAPLIQQNPNEKIIIFSTFKATIYYLEWHLREKGVSCISLSGDNQIPKMEILQKFEQEPINVLISTEVASEGIDLQFSSTLVNYDLPWNPMKVEQRIGRLDRIGQKSESIKIFNLIYQGTIDERIYQRLFLRLQIFERALGGIENILGKFISELTDELLTGQLSPEEQESKIDAKAAAIESTRILTDQLEEQAGLLTAFDQYILDQIQNKSFITKEDLFNYVSYFLYRDYQGTEIIKDENRVKIKLSDLCRNHLRDFINGATQAQNTFTNLLNPAPMEQLRYVFTTKPIMNSQRYEEAIDHYHVLIRFIRHRLESGINFEHKCISIKIKNENLPIDIDSGTYVFHIEKWILKGIIQAETLKYIVTDVMTSHQMEADDAEKLIDIALLKASNFIAPFQEMDKSIQKNTKQTYLKSYEILSAEQRQYYMTKKAENEDRVNLLLQVLVENEAKQVNRLNSHLRDIPVHNVGLRRITENKIQGVRDYGQYRRARLESSRTLTIDKKQVAVGIIKIED